MAQHFKDLVARQKAMEMVTEVYKLTDNFPRREVYSLTDQIRRAAAQFQAILRKGRRTTTTANFSISCVMLPVPLRNLKLNL